MSGDIHLQMILVVMNRVDLCVQQDGSLWGVGGLAVNSVYGSL